MKKYSLIIRTNHADGWIGLDLYENLNIVGDSCSERRTLYTTGGYLTYQAKFHREMNKVISLNQISSKDLDVIHKN